MWNQPKEMILMEKFGKNAKIAGVLFMILGFIGAMYPVFTSFATVVFVSWLMLFAGLMAGYFTYVTDRNEWSGWLKSIVLVGVALYMLLSPMGGVATLGLLFSIYFFMDAFSGFMMASALYPSKGWGIWTINAILSLVMAVIFIINWPFTSLYLIGLLVGFSLFFDGLALIMGGKFIQDMSKNERE